MTDEREPLGWYFAPISYCTPVVGSKALPSAAMPAWGWKDSA